MTPTSHWQRGCTDGKEGNGPKRPYPNANSYRDSIQSELLANQSYLNGSRFGTELRNVAQNQATEARWVRT